MEGGEKYPVWKFSGKKTVKKTSQDTNDLVQTLLLNRGLITTKQQQEFLSPLPPKDISLAKAGISLAEVKKLGQLLLKMKKAKKTTFIYGDYDADGICSTAILWEALYKAGFDILPFIPNRFMDGYGVKAARVEELLKKHPNLGLVITLDNGISAISEISKIKKKGLLVAVLDHHQKAKIYPKADVIIYDPTLCASGIAWFVARELTGKADDLLELSAIGTVADQMPLVGVNRALVKFGLDKLSKTQRVGLISLFLEAKASDRTMTTYDINYIIAPRLNAAGRLGEGLDSLRLLCTKDPSKASVFAKKLDSLNSNRQKMVEESMVLAKKQLDDKAKILIIAHSKYSEGVIGLIAGKLTEEFGLPTIVIAKGKKISKGSCRSVAGFNIIEAIRKFEKDIIGGGGHPMAAGFSIETGKIAMFTKHLLAYTNKHLTTEILTKKLSIDMQLRPRQVSKKTVSLLQQFNPVGLGNPTPSFLGRGLTVKSARLVGAGKHLKLALDWEGLLIEAIGFNFPIQRVNSCVGQQVDVVFSLEENTWNYQTNLQLKIKDIRFL